VTTIQYTDQREKLIFGGYLPTIERNTVTTRTRKGKPSHERTFLCIQWLWHGFGIAISKERKAK